MRESATSIKIFKNFTEKTGGLDVPFAAEGLSGGVLLGVKGQGGISFFDWASGGLVRRIEVEPKHVYWSESGELVTLACEDTFYVLRYDSRDYINAVQSGQVEDDGVESAFEIVADISQRSVAPLSGPRLLTKASHHFAVYGLGFGLATASSTPALPTDWSTSSETRAISSRTSTSLCTSSATSRGTAGYTLLSKSTRADTSKEETRPTDPVIAARMSTSRRLPCPSRFSNTRRSCCGKTWRRRPSFCRPSRRKS